MATLIGIVLFGLFMLLVAVSAVAAAWVGHRQDQRTDDSTDSGTEAD